MNNRTIAVSVDFVIDALESRYQEVWDLWSNEASRSLWVQALELVEECGLGDNITSPSLYVDNYLVNGEFVSKESDVEYWLENTSWDIDREALVDYSDDEIREHLESVLDEYWQEYCQDNALIYNEEYACLSF